MPERYSPREAGIEIGSFLHDYYKQMIEKKEISESALKSTIDPDYKPKGKKLLSNYRTTKITEEFIKANKKDYPFLKHIRTSPDTESCMWLDDKNPVAVVVVRKESEIYTWITSIDIFPRYRGYGLSYQVLDYATKKMGANCLTVAKDNEIAKKVYDKYGFREILIDPKQNTKVTYMALPGTLKESAYMNPQSVVYFTRDISPESLVKIYEALGIDLPGKVMVKISSGEPGGHHFLSPELIAPLVKKVNGTICDANTAYEGKRHRTRDHRQVMHDHGFDAIAPTDILDATGDKAVPVRNGYHLEEVRIGNQTDLYDSVLVLSHFKGHAMAGFGGALKNVAIGMASASGKALVHTAGKSDKTIEGPQQDFLRSMVDSISGITNYIGKDKFVYINIANNLSVDCDCDAHPAPPTMEDIGIFASTDPVAVDQACIDAVYFAEDSKDMITRIKRQTGLNILKYAAEHGIGSRRYQIVDMDRPQNLFNESAKPEKERIKLNGDEIEVHRKVTENPNDPVDKTAHDLTFYLDGKMLAQISISAVNSKKAFLYNFEVVESHRGKGYGTAILKWVMKNYKVNELTVDKDNARAIDLYKKFGFKIGKEFKEDGKTRIDMKINMNESFAPCERLKDAIDNIFSHNALVQLWTPVIHDTNGERYNYKLWDGEAWKIPEEYLDLDILSIDDIADDEHLGYINIIIDSDYVPMEESAKSEKLYPVYITLFSNDTNFGKLIRKATGSEYSHATVALDPTMNNMYSFSDIPYNEAKFFCAGFVRESIWSPEYTKNRHFRVLVTFVDKVGKDKIQKKIDYFINNFEKYNYNDIGLVQYYFKFKNTKKHDETKKMRWFCSEFVSAIVNSSDETEGFENILASPQDLLGKPNVIDLGKFTIPEFNEEELVRKTRTAEKEFRKHANLSKSVVNESADEWLYELIDESALNEIFNKAKSKKPKFDERQVQKYTFNLDWKLLYEKFKELFPKNDPSMRFDLFGVIVRYFLIPTKAAAVNVTQQIIDQMVKIASFVKNGFIKLIDAVSSLIFFQGEDGDDVMRYPDGPMHEAALNEYMHTSQIDSREERDELMAKYGLRQGGYGQRTSKEDEDRMKKSAEWEKKIPLKQRKKIYREDGHPEELIPSHEEVRDPVDDCLPIAEAASDSEIEKLLELNRKLNKYDYIDNSTGKNYKLRSPSQFESDHGETFKDSPYVKYRKVMYLPHVRGKVGGFIDVYTFSSEPETGIIVIAVEPAARGTGLSQKLVQKAIDDAPSLGIKKLIWRADTDNIASIKLAQKMGFADISDLKKNPDQYKYEMALNEAAKSSLKVNTSHYFISKDRLDEAASNSSKSHVYTEPLYRITYNDIGIYEAYKKACSFDEWRSFINSDAATWLDVPKIYNKDINHTSYFTKRGYELFQKNTYPVIIQKLNKRNIKVDQVVLDVKPVYEDLYQVVVPNSVNESSIQDSYQFELLDKSVHFYDKIDEAASYQAKGKLYEKFGFKLKKTFNSNGENGYEKGRFRWYQLDESAGVINEMAYEDYCDCFYAKLKSLAAQYNKRDDIFKHVAKVLKMEQKDLPKFDCHIQVSGEKQLCFSLVNSDTSFEIRCEYEKYLKEMIEDLEKDVDIKTKCPHIKSIWTADAEGTIYVNLDYEHINEAIADTHSLDREQKKRIADKYGLRQGGYGQRTSKEDEERMKKSAEWEKKIPLKQRKKIYREDGHPEELIPSHEEVREPEEDCLPIGETSAVADDTKGDDNNFHKGNKLIHWYDGWTADGCQFDLEGVAEGEEGAYRFEVDIDSKDNSFGTIYNLTNPDKSLITEATERVLVDPSNKAMVQRYRDLGYEFIPSIKNRGKAQPMFKINRSKPNKLYPVYIVLFYSGTALGKLIKAAAGPHFSHAAISFTEDLTEMYSFGRKSGLNVEAFVVDSIENEAYQRPDTQYAIYMVPATANQYDRMKDRINWFIKNAAKFKYNFSGLFKNYLGISDNPKYRYFCSQFVADILNVADPAKLYFADPSLVTPENFIYTTFAQYIVSGPLSEFDPKHVRKITDVLLAREIKNRNATFKNESASIPYSKPLTIRFTNDKIPIVTKSHYNRINSVYNDAEKIIQNDESDDRLVTDTMCKLAYAIEIMDRYLTKRLGRKDELCKDMIQLRSKILKLIMQGHKRMMSSSEDYDFQEIYNKSKYAEVPKTSAIIGEELRTLL